MIDYLYANAPAVADLIIYLTAIATMFATTFLRGFQNKNVAGGYTKLAGLFGYVMAVCDMITVGLIIKGGLTVAFIGAFGAAFGWMVGMVVHKKLLKKRTAAKKLKKRSRREEYFIHLIQEHLQEQRESNNV